MVTNKYRHLAVSLLESLNIADLFVTVTGGTCAGKAKPHPDPILLACERLQVASEASLMVGDSYDDEEAALAAGASYQEVTDGYSAQDTGRPDRLPPKRIASLLELL